MVKRKGGAKGGASKKPRKGARKAKGAPDWYSSDTLFGMFGEGRKRARRDAAGGAVQGEVKDTAQEQQPQQGGKPRKAGASRPPRVDADSEPLESDQSSDEEDEAPVSDAFSQLMSGLEATSKQLDATQRQVLRRVKNEQQGVEYDEAEDEEEEEEDQEEEDQEEVEEEDASASDSAPGGSDAELVIRVVGDSERAVGSAAQLEAEGDESGTHFERRFVKYYGMTDEAMEKCVGRQSVEEGSAQRERLKVSAGAARFLVTCLGGEEAASVAPPPAEVDFCAAARVPDGSTPEAVAKASGELELKSRLARRWLDYASRRDMLQRRRLGPALAETAVLARDARGLTALQSALAGPVGSYADLVFAARSIKNGSELRELYVLHALNHVFRSFDLVAKHNSRLVQAREAARRQREAEAVLRGAAGKGKDKEKGTSKGALPAADATDAADAAAEEEEHVRDQGFTRPKVLILVPNRLAGLRVVRLMLELLPPNVSVANKSKFWDEFSEPHVEEDGSKDSAASTRAEREMLPASESYDEAYFACGAHPLLREKDLDKRSGVSARPADWHAVFSGNNDEAFRLGIACVGRKQLKLFADFYRSDIIIATAVGLRMATGQEVGYAAVDGDGEEGEGAGEEGEDDEGLGELGLNAKEEESRHRRRLEQEKTDFLSSVELCVVDEADVIEMQNWQHLVDVLAAVNRKPIELREEMDFARIRPCFLVDGMARRFRQTLVFGAYPSAFLTALVSSAATGAAENVAGAQLWRPCRLDGVLGDIAVAGLAHKFVRCETAPAPAPAPASLKAKARKEPEDARLAYLEHTLLKALLRPEAAHTLLLIPSYLDFVAVRNLLARAAAGAGEEGPRSKGKPWKGKSKNRARGKDGKRVSRKDDDAPPQALFVCASEYTDAADVSRARGDFFEGRARVLLTTERFHFYNRFKLRGIHRIVCYSPPLHADFYAELSNLVEAEAAAASGGASITNVTLFDATDTQPLERVVGTAAAKRMLAPGDKRVFEIAPR